MGAKYKVSAIAKRASIIDESTAILRALNGTKEVWLSYHTKVTLYQKFSEISL